MKIIVATGGFDPVHSGHTAYLQAARNLGDHLIVGLNSDAWLERKKGRAFMPWAERANIVSNLRSVDRVIEFNDDDDTAIEAIRAVKTMFPWAKFVFANGGDRTQDNIPEMVFDDVEFVFGVGGAEKANSSSWILEEWKSPKTLRPWGYYRVLHDVPGMKVKELTVEPGQTLSMQRHFSRAEYWQVSEGRCVVEGEGKKQTSLETHDNYQIGTGQWHRLYNPFDQPCRIVEIQYGPNCIEEDIERVV
jgi:cytidyltransferase-like protein